MELLETQDPEKRKLIEASDRHKHEMEREVKALTDKTEKVLKNALIIGGALALTYIVVSALSSSKSKKKKVKAPIQKVEEDDQPIISTAVASAENSLLSQLGTKLVNTATLVLLDMAKDKLSEFLKPKKEMDENS